MPGLFCIKDLKLAMTYSSSEEVPSARSGLTAVFGMRTGGPHLPNHQLQTFNWFWNIFWLLGYSDVTATPTRKTWGRGGCLRTQDLRPVWCDHFSHIRVSNIFCISLVCICKLCQEGKSHMVIFAYIEGRGRGFDARGLRRPASGSIIPSFSRDYSRISEWP